MDEVEKPSKRMKTHFSSENRGSQSEQTLSMINFEHNYIRSTPNDYISLLDSILCGKLQLPLLDNWIFKPDLKHKSVNFVYLETRDKDEFPESFQYYLTKQVGFCCVLINLNMINHLKISLY